MRSTRILLALMMLLPGLGAVAQFGPEQTIYQEGPEGIEVLDLDNDGDNDVMISSRSGLQAFVNTNGAGQLTGPIMVDVTEVVGHAVDLNGDGYADMIGSGSLTGGIHWFPYLGTFGYGPAATIEPVINAEDIQSGDLDGDGDMDLVFALEDNTIQWSENTNGLGSFSGLNMLVYASDVVGLEVVDLDDDGDNDIVWTSSTTSQALWADNTDGMGTFNAPILLSSEGRGVMADIDGDGRQDLAMVDTWSNQVLWQRRALATVSFGLEQSVATSFLSPGTVLASDIDGDGDADILATSMATDEVLFFENMDGQGHFGTAQTIGWSIEDSQALCAGDLDNDGDMEVFAASGAQQRVVRFDNLANADNMISGRVFNDINNDGAFNSTDHGLYNIRVEIPGIGHTFTNHSGMYWFPAAPGTYNVEVTTLGGWTNSTPSNLSLSFSSGGSHGNDFGMNGSATPIHQLDAQLANAPTRCGMQIAYWIVVENTGNQVDDLHFSLDLEDLSGFVSASPAPVTNTGGIQTWDFAAVQPTHQRLITLMVQMADASHMGEILHDALTAQATHGGVLVHTSNCSVDPVLNCAYDPNDKQVMPEGEGDSKLTAMDAFLTYTIRFQNTGTIAAENVVIYDQLDGDLDPATVEFADASHPVHMLVGDDGQLVFTFNGIMLPDSGSDLEGSQGFVRFTVRAHTGLADMTPVHNFAEIVFDANPAIITNTTTNTLTYGLTGVGETLVIGDAAIKVQPNPAFDMATIHIGSGLVGRVTIDMYDESGRKMIRLVRNTSTVVIYREDMDPGVYLLVATDENGREATARLVWGR